MQEGMPYMQVSAFDGTYRLDVMTLEGPCRTRRDKLVASG